MIFDIPIIIFNTNDRVLSFSFHIALFEYSTFYHSPFEWNTKIYFGIQLSCRVLHVQPIALWQCGFSDKRMRFFNFRFYYCISIIISFTEWKVSITFLIDIEIIPVSPVLHRNILFNIFPYLLQREGRYSLFKSPKKNRFFEFFVLFFYLAARFLGYQGKTCLK